MSLWLVLVRILGFFVFCAVVGFVFYKLYTKWVVRAESGMHRHVIVAFVFCLLLSYSAEVLFGVADITGAFFAGLIISCTQRTQYLASKFDVLSYAYLSPIFFASIGLQVKLPEMSATVIWFSVALVLVAVVTKVVGCGLGAKLCGYQNYQCLRIGVGMISRGEVALIVASKGTALGLLGSSFLGPVILMVVITTVVTPVLLKLVFQRGGPSFPMPENEGFSQSYEQLNRYRSQEPFSAQTVERKEKSGGRLLGKAQ